LHLREAERWGAGGHAPKVKTDEEAGRKRVQVEQVKKSKEKEKEKEAEADAMRVSSETEARDDVMDDEDGEGALHPPDEEEGDEEREYVTIDVD
jgi:hypothetical protein